MSGADLTARLRGHVDLDASRETHTLLREAADRLAVDYRRQYERQRVRVAYALGWLTPESFDGDESRQHDYIAHLDVADGVRSRLREAKARVEDAEAEADRLRRFVVLFAEHGTGETQEIARRCLDGDALLSLDELSRQLGWPGRDGAP